MGASAEDCWRMHFAASYMISWGESLIEKAKEIQNNVHDLGLHGVESGAIAEPWPGMADVPEKTDQALERIVAQRRADR